MSVSVETPVVVNDVVVSEVDEEVDVVVVVCEVGMVLVDADVTVSISDGATYTIFDAKSPNEAPVTVTM